MDSSISKKCAEILVEAGYADGYLDLNEGRGNTPLYHLVWTSSDRCTINGNEDISVFADTLEGRRQADAIENYLVLEHYGLWFASKQIENNKTPVLPRRKWRLDRIKWCIQELIK